ncbi:uncharacterized protein METZ01_LOCUS322090, partial [marine metagenome]
MTFCFSGPTVALSAASMRPAANAIGANGLAAVITALRCGLTAGCIAPARQAKWWLSPLTKPSSYWLRIHLEKSALLFPLLPMESCISAHGQSFSRWAERIRS